MKKPEIRCIEREDGLYINRDDLADWYLYTLSKLQDINDYAKIILINVIQDMVALKPATTEKETDNVAQTTS